MLERAQHRSVHHYVREGKILGSYIKSHFKGKKIGYFYQDDEFGQDGVKGLDDEIPKSQVVSRQSYNPTVTNVAPQVTALKAAGAQVVVSFSVPAFTALLKLGMLKLNFNPQLASRRSPSRAGPRCPATR